MNPKLKTTYLLICKHNNSKDQTIVMSCNSGYESNKDQLNGLRIFLNKICQDNKKSWNSLHSYYTYKDFKYLTNQIIHLLKDKSCFPSPEVLFLIEELPCLPELMPERFNDE